MFIKASFSGHPTLLFSHRSKRSKIGHAGYAARTIQEIVFNVTRVYGETLTVERIRGEAIKCLLNNVTLESQEIMELYDISENYFDRLCQVLYAELETEGVVA